MRLAARTEGLILDPIYTGKAMAGLIDQARSGRLTAKDTVVFIHTGGLPALFVFKDEVLRRFGLNASEGGQRAGVRPFAARSAACLSVHSFSAWLWRASSPAWTPIDQRSDACRRLAEFWKAGMT